MSKRILLVDHSPKVRAMLRAQLESQPELEVCGEASDGIDAFEKAFELLPDLIVLDLSMSRMFGLEAARKVRDKQPHGAIITFYFPQERITGLKHAPGASKRYHF